MGGERVETTSDELERWAEQKASELGTSRADVTARALAAYRMVDESRERGPNPLRRVQERLTAVDGRVSSVETDLDEKVTDLRNRVIQVKREADAKAPEAHAHPELQDTIDDALDAVDDVANDVSALERRMDRGFENYEDILEYLTDATEETEDRLEAAVGVVVELRRRVEDLEGFDAERAAVGDLKREANRAGVSTAKCESCSETVKIALLEAPYCPHCGETLAGVEPKRRLLGSSWLTTGTRPALEEPETEEGDRTASTGESGFEWGGT
ncbi:hypothetical protein [Halogeometricum limi]|uniref:Uncharacterized protein n=1 Tax=Halogeometricum limi TaxID=555875 RepID=A0A1I6HKS0_9EURY|nr:hypothetical protein [Halogeometricum limi]SFR55032.1 hypothetical protein SAMN04488124_2349 [Halogeometricum limi]